MVIQLAFNLMGDYDEALDVSQEVFLRVFRTIGGFRAQSSLRTWIFRIVVNQARNRQRWWRRRRRDAQVPIESLNFRLSVTLKMGCSSVSFPIIVFSVNNLI